MKGNFMQRIERLESKRAPRDLPKAIFATCPIPIAKPTTADIANWLEAGTAHIAFNGAAIMYDGSVPPLTVQQWQALHAPPKQTCS